MNIPITNPLGELVFEAELIKRELGNSTNHAIAYVMEDDGLNWMIYEDIEILM